MIVLPLRGSVSRVNRGVTTLEGITKNITAIVTGIVVIVGGIALVGYLLTRVVPWAFEVPQNTAFVPLIHSEAPVPAILNGGYTDVPVRLLGDTAQGGRHVWIYQGADGRKYWMPEQQRNPSDRIRVFADGRPYLWAPY